LRGILAGRTDEEALGVFTMADGGGMGSCCITAARIEALAAGAVTEGAQPL
jgi:hypothetical protein